MLVSSPELVYEVTQGQFDSFVNRRNGISDSIQSSHSLFLAKDDEWRFFRRIISPTFNAVHMKIMMKMMDASVDRLCEKLDQYVRTGEVFNIQ